MPPIRGAGHITGLGWARLLAWVSLGLGIASLGLAFFAPLAGDLSRPVGIAFFASFAIWFGLMAEPRYRSVRRRGSALSKSGVTLGIAAFAIAAYAFVAIVLASYGTQILAPTHWLSSSAVDATSGALLPAAVDTEVPAPAPELLPPTESERLALAQSVGTAVYVLEQAAAPDGTWPASLAVTTDAATLMTPDGITLAPLPPGAQVSYSTSPDLRQFSLTLLGPLGAVATYDSTSATISSSVP